MVYSESQIDHVIMLCKKHFILDIKDFANVDSAFL